MDESYERATGLLAKAVEELDKRQAQIKKAVTSYKKQGAATDLCAAYRWLKANKDVLERESPATLESTGELERLCKDSLHKLEADLHDASSAEAWDVSGQWPKYYIEHFLPVVIDEENLAVTVGEEKLPTLDLKKVVASAKAQLNKLRPDRNTLPTFLRELLESYSRLARPQTPSVSVWDVYRDMVMQRQPRKLWRDAAATSFRPFREIEFRALLTELLKANLTVESGKQLRLHPPAMKDESMYIYQPAENRFCHVGRIEFSAASGEGGNFA